MKTTKNITFLGIRLYGHDGKLTVEALTDIMRKYNNEVAYGSECAAWADYVSDCHDLLGGMPWDDEISDKDVPDTFGIYWLEVANGLNPDYVQATGDRSGDY